MVQGTSAMLIFDHSKFASQECVHYHASIVYLKFSFVPQYSRNRVVCEILASSNSD